MKVLILTNLFPYVGNRSRGIFITNRLKHYNALGIDYDAVALANRDGVIVKKLKFVLGRTCPPDVLNQVNTVKYSPVYVRRNVVFRSFEQAFDPIKTDSASKKICPGDRKSLQH